jgi:pimeloyl-ACP methyl ester carboxylesterase
MMRKFGILLLVSVCLMAPALTVPAEAMEADASGLRRYLLKRNELQGRPYSKQEIEEFCRFMAEPRAEVRQTPSIQVGFYDSPGSATDKDIALGDRIPLILVHGMSSDIISDGEYGRPLNDLERWIGYIESFNADSGFYTRYKVYRFVYDSRLAIEENGANLVTVIDNIASYAGWGHEDLDGREFVVLAHSMGGLVARAALNTQFTIGTDAGDYFGDHVINLVTLGTPHRGSPMAVPAWVYDSVLRGSGITELEYFWSYTMHLAFEANEGEFDLAWDNYDDAVPLTDIQTYTWAFIPTLREVGGTRAQHEESLMSPYTGSLYGFDLFTGSLILYSATNPPKKDVNDMWDLLFYYTLGLLNEHHLLGFSYNKLAQVIAGDLGEGNLKLYGDNDGLVPAVSATFDGEAVSYVEVFNNSDHLSLLDQAPIVGVVKAKLIDIVTAGP